LAVETLTEPLRYIATALACGEHPSTERRQHQRSRIGFARPAVVHIDPRNAALVDNLGLGGMRVRALGRPLAPGATLRLEFQLPGLPEPMHTQGVVAWVNDAAEAGVQFVKLPEAKSRRLREWLAKHQILNAAREFMRVAGDWQAALDLIAEMTRTLTGAGAVEIVLAGRRALASAIAEGLPIRATVAAPIEEGERIIGHLEICSTEFGAFDEADLRIVSVLAAVLSEMVRLRAAARQEAAAKPRLAARIVNRVEEIFPRTIRVRVVF
jgi:hypothetical protein